MEGKGKIIFPIIVTGIIVFIVSFLVTFLNIGFRADFVFLWLKAFFHGLAARGRGGILRNPAGTPSHPTPCGDARRQGVKRFCAVDILSPALT